MENEQLTEIAIFVDGNNFYKGLEKSAAHSRFDLNLFDYEKFVAFIAVERKITIKRYYKGVIKKEPGNIKSQRMVSEQQGLFSKLEGNGWEIKRGRMSKNTEFGRCEGFYFFQQKIENNGELKTLSELILKEHQFHYSPIIIISHNNQNWESLQDALGNIGKGLSSAKGIYFALNRWREKGVDVNIAIDMLDLAHSYKSEGKSGTMVLVSSDSDLKPVVERVRSLGSVVEYVGFEHMYSIALLNAANKRILLTEKQVEEFLPNLLILKETAKISK